MGWDYRHRRIPALAQSRTGNFQSPAHDRDPRALASVAMKIRRIRDVRRLLDIHGGIKEPRLRETRAAGIRHLNPAHWSAP